MVEHSLDQTTVVSYVSQFSDILVTRFVVALTILFIGLLAGLIIGKILRKILVEIELNEIIRRALQIQIKADELISNFVSWGLYVLTVLLVLNQLGIASFVINAVSIFIILLAIVLVFIGLKDFVPNILAGLRLSKRDLFTVGDVVRVDRIEGVIEDISLLEVVLRTKSGDMMLLPTSYLIHSVIKVRKDKSARPVVVTPIQKVKKVRAVSRKKN